MTDQEMAKFTALNRLYHKVERWAGDTFNHPNSISALKHMQEEIADELLGENGDLTDIYEYADLFILWVDAVRSAGFTFPQIVSAISEKHDVNEKRQWQKPDAEGIVRHVKAGESDPDPLEALRASVGMVH